MIHLTQTFKIVQGYVGQGTTALVTTDSVSLKNAVMAWIVVNLDTTASSACALIPYRSLTVGGAGVVLANTVPIWVNANVAATDTLVMEAADALNFTTVADASYKQVIFQIDPAGLGGAYDCIYLTLGALAATEAMSVEFFIQERYQQATPPAAITD